jgi:hypothetical protein
VYAKNLTLHKGVDNRLQFQFINQEQKPVDITDKEITCRIISHDGTVELIRKTLTPLLPLKGLAELQLHADDLHDIESQPGHYSLEIPEGEFDLPVFVDSNSGARGTIKVVDSVKPKHQSSDSLTIESHREAVHYAPVTYYSGEYLTDGNPLLTTQVYFEDYTGNVQFEGTTLTDSDWYEIGEPYVYDTQNGTVYYTIEGFHARVRVKFADSANGNATKILVR